MMRPTSRYHYHYNALEESLELASACVFDYVNVSPVFEGTVAQRESFCADGNIRNRKLFINFF